MLGRRPADAALAVDAAFAHPAVIHAALVRRTAEPDGVHLSSSIPGKGRAMVRADIDPPVVEGGSHHFARLAFRGQHAHRVIAHVGCEHVPPDRLHRAVLGRQEPDAAALAAVVRQLVVAAECRAAVVGHSPIHRSSAIRPLAPQGLLVALVDPGDEHLALRVHGQGIEAVRDLLPVSMHDRGGAEGHPAIDRARIANLSRVRLGQRPGPGDVQRPARAGRDLGTGVPTAVGGLRGRRDAQGLAPAASEVVGAADRNVPRLLVRRPEHALLVEDRRRRQLRPGPARGHAALGLALAVVGMLVLREGRPGEREGRERSGDGREESAGS